MLSGLASLLFNFGASSTESEASSKPVESPLRTEEVDNDWLLVDTAAKEREAPARNVPSSGRPGSVTTDDSDSTSDAEAPMRAVCTKEQRKVKQRRNGETLNNRRNSAANTTAHITNKALLWDDTKNKAAVQKVEQQAQKRFSGRNTIRRQNLVAQTQGGGITHAQSRRDRSKKLCNGISNNRKC